MKPPTTGVVLSLPPASAKRSFACAGEGAQRCKRRYDSNQGNAGNDVFHGIDILKLLPRRLSRGNKAHSPCRDDEKADQRSAAAVSDPGLLLVPFRPVGC